VTSSAEPVYIDGKPISTVDVESDQAFNDAIQHYAAQGFNVVHREFALAVLERPKKKMSGATKLLLGLTVFPVLIPIGARNIAKNADRIIAIRLRQSAYPDNPNATDHAVGQMSPDFQYWWNGSQWVDADDSTPPRAPRNDDGSLWWDGAKWRAVR